MILFGLESMIPGFKIFEEIWGFGRPWEWRNQLTYKYTNLSFQKSGFTLNYPFTIFPTDPLKEHKWADNINAGSQMARAGKVLPGLSFSQMVKQRLGGETDTVSLVPGASAENSVASTCDPGPPPTPILAFTNDKSTVISCLLPLLLSL